MVPVELSAYCTNFSILTGEFGGAWVVVAVVGVAGRACRLSCRYLWPRLAPRPDNSAWGHQVQPQPGSAAARTCLAAYPLCVFPVVALCSSAYATGLGRGNAGLDAQGRVKCAQVPRANAGLPSLISRAGCASVLRP